MSFQPTAFARSAVKGFTIQENLVGLPVLLDILSRPRFHESEGEKYMIGKYLAPLPGATFDDHGNIWVQIGDEPVTMFSAHTDTVHKKTALNVAYKLHTSKDHMLTVKGGGVLGADCGTGIWMMLNLIANETPGLYIFHRAEELGRQGSEAIAKDPALAARLQGIKHCVAFDRKDTTSVITHQLGSRCCSAEFAKALAAQLSLGAPAWREDDTGSFTDSASYTHIIPECTNLSVGYYDQHTTGESQNLPFASWMANRLLEIDWANLPAVRDPAIIDEDDDFWPQSWGNYTSSRRTSLYGTADALPKNLDDEAEHELLTSLIKNFPAEFADFLIERRYSLAEMAEELEVTYDCDTSYLLDMLP